MKRRELLKTGAIGTVLTILRPKQDEKVLAKPQKVEPVLKTLDLQVQLFDSKYQVVTESQPFQFVITPDGLTNANNIQFAECSKTCELTYYVLSNSLVLWHYGPLMWPKIAYPGDQVHFSRGSLCLNLGLRKADYAHFKFRPIDSPPRLGDNVRRKSPRYLE